MTEEKFNYAQAMAELDEIVSKVEKPDTSMEDIGILVKRSRILIKACREYLRELREDVCEE